jgi:hypothetical protein
LIWINVPIAILLLDYAATPAKDVAMFSFLFSYDLRPPGSLVAFFLKNSKT